MSKKRKRRGTPRKRKPSRRGYSSPEDQFIRRKQAPTTQYLTDAWAGETGCSFSTLEKKRSRKDKDGRNWADKRTEYWKNKATHSKAAPPVQAPARRDADGAESADPDDINTRHNTILGALLDEVTKTINHIRQHDLQAGGFSESLAAPARTQVLQKLAATTRQIQEGQRLAAGMTAGDTEAPLGNVKSMSLEFYEDEPTAEEAAAIKEREERAKNGSNGSKGNGGPGGNGSGQA